MAVKDGYRRLLRGFRRRPRSEARTEIETHLQMAADELRARGMDPDEAATEARRRFGDVAGIESECRHLQRQISWRESLQGQLDGWIADIRHGVRILRHGPGFAAFAIATLALGIGGATAVFSVANGLFLRPVAGVRDAGRLVELSQGAAGDFISVSYPVLRAIREQVEELDGVAGFDTLTVAIGDDEHAAQVTMGLQVTAGYFETLATRTALGRFFAADEADYPRVRPVAVISHALWQGRFAGVGDIVGRSTRVNGVPVEIIGVTEEGFHGHAAALQLDLFVPVGVPIPGVHGAVSLEGQRNGMFDTLGRLAPGVSRTQAQAAVEAAANRLVQRLEGDDARYPMQLLPYAPIPGVARLGVAAFLGVLLLVVTLVLGISCVNITNLQLSRAAQRRREIAVRVSLGAGRSRIVRQLLVESLVIFALGALVGTIAAAWATAFASGIEPSIPLPGARLALDLSVDGRVLAFALVTTLVAGIASGVVPGLHAARRHPVAGLRDGGNATSGRMRVRSVLVAGQAAATVVLLIIAGLFLRSFRASQQVDPGFVPENIVVATFDMELAGYGTDEGALFWQRLLEQVAAMPGVERASLAHKLPISSRSQWSVNSPGVDPPEGTRGFVLSNRRVSAGYLETLGYRMVRGRTLRDTDDALAGNVIVVNETLAQRVWPGQDPLGRVLDNGRARYEVVGVAADTVYHGLHEATPGFGFVPLAQNYNEQMILHARVQSVDAEALRQLHAALRALDGRVPVMGFAVLTDALRLNFLGDFVGAILSASFGLVGLLLAAVGLYGVTSFWAAQRRAEIGLRMALGATARGVVRWTVLRGLRAPAIGMLVGLALAVALARLLASVVSGVSTFDPVTFTGVAVFLVAIGVLATWLPARRAARIEPAETLRTY